MSQVPDTLLRFFSSEEYARQFIAGWARFGLLDYYRSIEDSRKDDKEGHVSFAWKMKAPQVTVDRESGRIVGWSESDQNIRYTGSSLNQYYIISTSHPEADVSLLAGRFGRFVVRIADPLTLLERIKTAWRNHALALTDGVCIAPVVYDKDGLLDPDPHLIAPFHYSYLQKPKAFDDEREFRYVIKCKVDTRRTFDDFITLNIGDCGDISSLDLVHSCTS